METPEIRLNEVETFEAGDSSTVVTENHEFTEHTTMEATSTGGGSYGPLRAGPETEQRYRDYRIVHPWNALPGDQALLVGLDRPDPSRGSVVRRFSPTLD